MCITQNKVRITKSLKYLTMIWTVQFRFPTEAQVLLSPRSEQRSLSLNEHWRFLLTKAAETWNWPITAVQIQVKKKRRALLPLIL